MSVHIHETSTIQTYSLPRSISFRASEGTGGYRDDTEASLKLRLTLWQPWENSVPFYSYLKYEQEKNGLSSRTPTGGRDRDDALSNATFYRNVDESLR